MKPECQRPVAISLLWVVYDTFLVSHIALLGADYDTNLPIKYGYKCYYFEHLLQ